MTEQQQGRGIAIDQLGIDQLSGLQQQLDKELSFFADSLNELKDVQTKFNDSRAAVGGLDVSNFWQKALIPVSESMYVSGVIRNVNSVLVDIGTGYYAEMTHEKARNYFKRKEEYLRKQIETVEGILTEKQQNRQVIIETLQSKVQMAFQAQHQKSANR